MQISNIQLPQSQPRILFVNTNGAGLGHMSRCLAYARRLRGRAAPYFFSLASAIEIIEEMGFPAEYFVSPNWSTNNANDWNRELSVRLGMLLEQVRPQMVVFDGTWPYKGFLQACRSYGEMHVVWSNRGLHREDKQKKSPDVTLFDLVVQPGELGMEFSTGIAESGCRKLMVPPVCLLDADELLDRAAARSALGLRSSERYVLFSLGAGNINDFGEVASGLIRRFHDAGFSVVWASNPISVKDVELPEGIEPVSVYPLVRYMRAFDAFVGAAGYNTCCETVQACVPSLLVPNTNTKLDDQVRRAMRVAENAPAVVSACETEKERDEAVERLLCMVDQRHSFKNGIAMNGAAIVADALLALIRDEVECGAGK